MKKQIKENKKLISSKIAVSEVLGTVLLLGIAVAIFSVLYFIVLSEPFETNETNPIIVSTVVNDTIVFEHRGGDSMGLNSIVPLTVDGQRVLLDGGRTPTVGDLLIDKNENNQWDVGEVLSFDYYNFGYTINSEEADATTINEEGTDIIFSGALDISPTSDIGIHCSVNNSNPRIGEKIEITIVVSHFRGNLDLPEGLVLNFLLPEGLQYSHSITESGSYDNVTGDWDLGEIGIRQSSTLKIIANVTSLGIGSEFTQVAMLLDGSGSISTDDWNLMTNGLANAIEDKDIFPHDGSVELTVIQFGGYYNPDTRAKVEIEPTIVDSVNYNSLSDICRNITQMVNNFHQGGTPAACAFYLGADQLANSVNFSEDYRQVINFITDGVPTWSCDCDEDLYIADSDSSENPYISAENARDYLLNTTQLSQDQDELNSLAVGVEGMYGAPDVDWLNGSIIWPEPGYIWDITSSEFPPGPGWVATIDTFDDFEYAIDEMFKLLFNSINIQAKLKNNLPIEINIAVKELSVNINPKEAN